LWPNIRFLPSIVVEKNATKNEHICSMCIKINKVGKQEVGIWWVQKRFPRYGVPIWNFLTKYQICVINSCWEKCDEKCAHMFNVYKNQLSRQTGSRNLTGPKTLPTISYGIPIWSLGPNMPRKISWTDGRTDRCKTVYPTHPPGSRGIMNKHDTYR
jgi:hypothetical protein